MKSNASKSRNCALYCILYFRTFFFFFVVTHSSSSCFIYNLSPLSSSTKLISCSNTRQDFSSFYLNLILFIADVLIEINLFLIFHLYIYVSTYTHTYVYTHVFVYADFLPSPVDFLCYWPFKNTEHGTLEQGSVNFFC